MKLSITMPFTANDKPYNDLLIESINETISLSDEEYEIIPHKNDEAGLTGSLAHAIGLTEGYKKCKGEIVLFLDSDTTFLKNNWSKELLRHFEDDNVALAGAILCEAYESPFYRAHFLAVRSSFYKNFIINEKGFFPDPPLNDTAYRITAHCLSNNKKHIHYKNSLNDNVPSVYQGPDTSGETVYDSSGKAFFHHVGRGVFKPYRFERWKNFVENYDKT